MGRAAAPRPVYCQCHAITKLSPPSLREQPPISTPVANHTVNTTTKSYGSSFVTLNNGKHPSKYRYTRYSDTDYIDRLTQY